MNNKLFFASYAHWFFKIVVNREIFVVPNIRSHRYLANICPRFPQWYKLVRLSTINIFHPNYWH